MNGLKTMAVAFLAAVAVAGCATSYRATNYDGGAGFSSTQLGENIFEVRFQGNDFTSSEKASNFALLRAAELTLENGFGYFIVNDDENTRQTGVFTTPVWSSTTYSFAGSTTNYYGGNTYSVSTPNARKIIVCFKEKPDWSGPIYDALFVVQSIKGKYAIEFNDKRAESPE